MKDSQYWSQSNSLEASLKLALKDDPDNQDAIILLSRLKSLERENKPLKMHPHEYEAHKRGLLRDWLTLSTNLTEDEIDQIIQHTHLSINEDEILSKFRIASHQLNEWKSLFIKNQPTSHIERPETRQILKWIEDPLPEEEKGIALLVGDPGAGKSVILRDVLRELGARTIPVLGIKADQYCSGNPEMLEKRLVEFTDMLKDLTYGNDRIVILIDQIDALSQSLSARREYLDSYTEFVLRVSEIPNVRAILSCRLYDLQNDEAFSFYRNQRRFSLGKLSKEEVYSIFALFSRAQKPTGDLLLLLQTPLHLALFCQIYQSGLPFDADKIKTLHDLYKAFWLQKVVKVEALSSTKVDSKKTTQLLYKLARTMYETFVLAVPPFHFQEAFHHELEYLKTTGIVHESSEGLTFFHQTFYEFTFAKQFVEQDTKIEKYILDNWQNLNIRSCIKMMIEFLREYDRNEYLRVFHAILDSEEYLFHIKSLLLSLLGYIKNPSEAEMLLARNLIFPNPSLFKSFVIAVKSRAWLLFLLDENKLQILVTPSSDTSIKGTKDFNILQGLLVRHLPESRQEVLAFVASLPMGETRFRLAQITLHKIGIWDDPVAFRLFDDYANSFVDAFFKEFLEKVVESNPEKQGWAIKHLRPMMEKELSNRKMQYGDVNLSYMAAMLISHFIKNCPELVFDLLLDFQMRQICSPEAIKISNLNSPIYSDLFIFEFDSDDDIHDKTGLFSLLSTNIQILSKNQLPRFSRFVAESLDSNSLAQLLLLVEGFRANPAAYASEIARFFSIFMKKRGFDLDGTLPQRVQQLLEEAYQYFPELQKLNIIQIVSQMESKDEAEWATNKKPEWIGYRRFQWLKCFPKNDITQIPEVEAIFQKSLEQFPETEHKESNKSGVFVSTPPLEKEDYDNFALKQWIESFVRFDENYREDLGSQKGGMIEHARQFGEEVKKRPDFFYPLLDDITKRSDLPLTYLLHGLEGLKEVNYAPERLLHLFKKIDVAGVSSEVLRRLISFCGGFANKKIEDDSVIHFLVKMATKHTEPMDDSSNIWIEDDPVESEYLSGFNTIRGIAVHLLPYFFYFKKHENLIFEALEQVAETDLPSIRCQMATRLALLINLDKSRSLRLFLRLIRDGEAAVMEESPWSAQHFAKQDFAAMKPYFENALAYPRIHRSMGIILSMTWVLEWGDALELLNQFVEASDAAKAGAIEVAVHNLCDSAGNLRPKSLELFERFLGEQGREVIQAYNSAFSDLKPSDFPFLYPALLRFAPVLANQEKPLFFYEYLIACARHHPEPCLELMECLREHGKADSFARLYGNEPLKVVLNVYHTLYGRQPKDIPQIKKVLLLFDQILLDDVFQEGAESILADIER